MEAVDDQVQVRAGMTIEERAARLRTEHCKVCNGCPGKVGDSNADRHDFEPCKCPVLVSLYMNTESPMETALDALALAYDVLADHPTWTARHSIRFAYSDIVRRLEHAAKNEGE